MFSKEQRRPGDYPEGGRTEPEGEETERQLVDRLGRMLSFCVTGGQ